MTQFTRKSFSVGMAGDQQYRDNWEACFRKVEADAVASQAEENPVLVSLKKPLTEGDETRGLADALSLVEDMPGYCDRYREEFTSTADGYARGKAFRQAMELPSADLPMTGPQASYDKAVRTAVALVVEEFCEVLLAATQDPVWVERRRADLVNGLVFPGPELDINIPELAKELADLDYVTEQLRQCLGIDGRPIARLVHESNMAKAGGPKREDGKQLKPEGWKPPDIEGELRRQGWKP